MASDSATLSFDRTVPRHLAHRRALGEVFIADSARTGEDEFLLAVQVPRAHSVWFDRRAAYHDPLSTAEAARQGSFVVVHRYLDVPHGLPFSLQRFEVKIEDLRAYRDDGRSPLEGVLRFRLSSQDKRSVDLGTMCFDGDLTIDGSLAMTFGGGIVFLPKPDYEALRDYQRAGKPLDPEPPEPVAPIDAARVGRLDRRNVVVGAPVSPRTNGEARYPVVVDRGHPSFFDHEYDHVPGPLIVEAFRQAAIVTATEAGSLPSPVTGVTACEAAFSDFAEFEGTIWVSASPNGAAREGSVAVDVRAHQFDRPIAEGVIELTPYP